jgi:hypothetical protein
MYGTIGLSGVTIDPFLNDITCPPLGSLNLLRLE